MANIKGTKKMNEVIEAEVKDVDFGDDLELKISKPSLNSDKTLSISGNFSELGAKIQKVVDKYKGTELTEDNVSYIKTLKGQFASLRTGIERERKEYKKVYITPASKLIDSMCDELQKIVAEGENALGVQLEEYDQKRKNEITVVLTEFIDDVAEKFKLREEYKAQIQLIEKYYNKTQDEADSMADIERQAEELSKKQKEYDSGVAIIQAECNDAGLLPDAYLRELQYKSAMEIILEIKQDRKTRDEIKAKADEEGKLTVGEPLTEELKRATTLDSKEKEAETRTRVLRVTYKSSQAKLMASFFRENGIQFEFIQTDF
jgi:hypothetical protein